MPIQFIPNIFGPKTPHSEKLVADWLKADLRASRYTVYHSHGLGAHERVDGSKSSGSVKPHGEIDFVVLVPPAGIVTVEIKGDEVSRKSGVWYQKGNGYSQRINDPIAQMVSNQHELKRRLSTKLTESADLQALTFAGLVIFPKTDHCPEEIDIESNEWEIASYAEIQKNGISGCIERAINRTKRTLKKNCSAPSAGLMSRVKSVIRADFDLPVSPIVLREEEEKRRTELTEQQYQFLSVVEANGKAFVEGGAGTGKTLLALEFAKRELLQGRSVGLFCYNNLLGHWLKGQCDALQGNIGEEKIGSLFVGTFQSWLRSVVHNNSEVKTLMDQEILFRGDQHFWEILDECAALAIEDLEPKFDTVIIDEMQDFQNPAWLPLIDKCLALGLKDGRWALFGDYSRQAIYTERGNTFGADELQKELHGYGAYSVRVPLTLNCRNTKRIIEMTRALTSFDWASANGLGPEGERVQRLYYKSSEEQFEKIQMVHAKFLEEKFDPNDMVLLWDAMSGADRFEERAYLAGLNLCDWTGDSLHQTAIQSASIQRFKGLEANAVIVCNMQGLSDFVIQQKLYVAMTRARSRLALILPHHLKDKVDDLMSSYFGGQNYVQS